MMVVPSELEPEGVPTIASREARLHDSVTEEPTPVEEHKENNGSTVLSPTMALRLKLADEVRRIRKYAGEWKGGERKVRFWTRVIVGLVKGML